LKLTRPEKGTVLSNEALLAMVLLTFILVASVISESREMNPDTFPEFQGISPGSEISLTIDPNEVIGINNLSLGFMLNNDIKDWLKDPVLRQLAQNANFRLIRFFDFAPSTPRLMPCTYWNETTETGTFNWTYVDVLLQKIFEIGAEPLICLGSYSPDGSLIPLGMTLNASTNLPRPQSYRAYASQWVQHFKAVRLPVRFYEIWNEPWHYFGWNTIDFAKLSNYVQFFNTIATYMRQENPSVLVSHDFIIRKPVLDYWLANGGADIDFLDFHKYDSWFVGQTNDTEILARAESQYFEKWPMGYSLEEARQIWFKARGKYLLAINSESNLNSDWRNGTDPRIQSMLGAVWTALVLRMGVLNGLSYNVYHCFASSAAWERAKPTGGEGYGLVNTNDDKPWYPYYVHYVLGNSLAVGDRLVNATSSSDDAKVLAWIHDGTVNVFAVLKVDQPRKLHLGGLQGKLDSLKIDNTSQNIQVGFIDAKEVLIARGYTIMLLRILSDSKYTITSSGRILTASCA
jgi:hypothetical protein